MILSYKLLALLGSVLLWGFYWVPFGLEVYDDSLFLGEVNNNLKIIFPYAFFGIHCLAACQMLKNEKTVLASKHLNMMVYSLVLLSLSLFFSSNINQSLLYFPFLVTLFLVFFIREDLYLNDIKFISILGISTAIGTLLYKFSPLPIAPFSLALGWLLFAVQILRSSQVSEFQKWILFILTALGLIVLQKPQIFIIFLFLFTLAPVWILKQKRPKTTTQWFYGGLALLGGILAWPPQIDFSLGHLVLSFKNFFFGTGPGQYFMETSHLYRGFSEGEEVISILLWFYEWGMVGVIGMLLFFRLVFKTHKREVLWFYLVLLLGFLNTQTITDGNNLLWWGILLFIPFETPAKNLHSHATHPPHS